MTKLQLSPERRKLLVMMSSLNFGFIYGLELQDGEPRFGPGLKVIADVKLDGQRGPRPEQDLDDFFLKDQHINFFEELDRIGSGSINEISIRHGIPCRLLVNHQGA